MAGRRDNAEAIARAIGRRMQADKARLVRVESNVFPTLEAVNLRMKERVRIAGMHLQSRVVDNIGRPVTKTPVRRMRTVTRGGVTRRKGSGYTLVTDRSAPGEMPKADTTTLMKSVFNRADEPEPGVYEGQVGTPVGYGIILETSERLDRAFLTRTLNEEMPALTQILTGAP